MDFDEMRKQLDEEPKKAEAWRPQAGEELLGEVAAVSEREGDGDRGPYPILTVREPDGTLTAFHAFHSVAKSQIEEQGPRPGDKIGVRYMGQEESKSSGRSYHNYRMVLDRAARAPEPAAVSVEEDDDADPIPF